MFQMLCSPSGFSEVILKYAVCSLHCENIDVAMTCKLFCPERDLSFFFFLRFDMVFGVSHFDSTTIAPFHVLWQAFLQFLVEP